jgi:hypothetical protein
MHSKAADVKCAQLTAGICKTNYKMYSNIRANVLIAISLKHLKHLFR